MITRFELERFFANLQFSDTIEKEKVISFFLLINSIAGDTGVQVADPVNLVSDYNIPVPTKMEFLLPVQSAPDNTTIFLPINVIDGQKINIKKLYNGFTLKINTIGIDLIPENFSNETTQYFNYTFVAKNIPVIGINPAHTIWYIL